MTERELTIQPKPIQMGDFKLIVNMNKDQLKEYVDAHFGDNFPINLAQRIDVARKIVCEEADRLFKLQKSELSVPIPDDETIRAIEAEPAQPEQEAVSDEKITISKADLEALVDKKVNEARKRGLSPEERKKCFLPDGITPRYLRSKNNGGVFMSNPHMLERIGDEFTACDSGGNSIDASAFERIQTAQNKRKVEVRDFDVLD